MTEGKGRPTPKRSEAQAARRKPLVQPRAKGRKGSSRGLDAEARRAMRQAMREGDERNYPPVAAGPERAAVRDAVDARRPFWLLALPLWLVGLVMTLIPSPVARGLGSLVFPVVVGVLLWDAVAARRLVRRTLAERFPGGTTESLKTLVWYGTARNMQFRRNRLPRPRVSPGQR